MEVKLGQFIGDRSDPAGLEVGALGALTTNSGLQDLGINVPSDQLD